MLASIATILVLAWAAMAAGVWLLQPRLVFFPYAPLHVDPRDIDLDFEDVTLTTTDGEHLHGWFVPNAQARATVLFFHGNAGNISGRLDSIRIFHDLGLSVFIVDYRGYGRSSGKPSETGLYRDGEAAWHYLVSERRLAPSSIVVFGRSLGGAVAARVASREGCGALILESTFTSLVDMGRHYYPFLPVSLLARLRFPTIERIRDVHCPLLVVHSPQDDIVPYRFGRRLYDAAPGPKAFLEIHGGHNEGFIESEPQYRAGLAAFLARYPGTPAPAK